MFLNKAQLLNLTASERVVLTGGLRAMSANHDGSDHGIFTDRVGVLTNDFFTVLTSTDFEWKKVDPPGYVINLNDRKTGQKRFTATRADLVFNSSNQLRVLAEVYAGADGHQCFVQAFVKAWDKVMMLDRYDVKA